MVDKEVIAKLKAMREGGGEAKPSDALLLYEFIKQVAAENEDLKEELEDMDLIQVQFVVSDGGPYKYWVKAGDSKFEYGEGEIDDPNVTMTATAETWGALGSGEADSTSAYMSGDLQIDGNLQDAIAYGEVLSIAMEAFEDLE